MSRSRNIKPGFFKNDLLAECEPMARILFAGLWCEADREGRLEYRPKKIKAACLPYDECDIDTLLRQLETHGFILRYEVGGFTFIQVLAFDKHQNPHKNEAASTIPAPELYGASTVQVPNYSEALRLIPDSLNLIPDSKESAPASHAQPTPAGKKASKAVTFKTWHESLPEDAAVIPEDHFIFDYAAKVGLSRDYLELAWAWFEDRYSSNAKRYSDWPAVFANAVKGNWGKIWWIDGDGLYSLTTNGKQLLAAAQNEALKRVAA